jgi:methylated-DNA-[protein]-cysteine S-methyltransferase
MEPTFFSVLDSPVGELTMRWRGGALTGLFFENSKVLEERASWFRDDAQLASVRAALQAYLQGESARFDVPLAPEGTPFQRAVWQALRAIPFGTTTTYGELAKKLGKPQAKRAVGAANGQNPIVIVVPCHRVVGADGSLVGFGGGLARKRWLLAHESRRVQTDLFA